MSEDRTQSDPAEAQEVSVVGWRNWGDHPLVVALTVVASIGGLVFGYVSWRGGGAAPALGEEELDPCVDVIGRWDWLTTGGIVSVVEGGTLTFHVNDATPIPTFRGTWTCSDETGEIVMRWETGLSDELTLSDDGDRLSGTNQQNGVVISAVRAR